MKIGLGLAKINHLSGMGVSDMKQRRKNRIVRVPLATALIASLIACGHSDYYDGPPACSPFGDYGFTTDLAYVVSSGVYVSLQGTAFSEPPVSTSNCPNGPDTNMTVKFLNRSNGISSNGYMWYALQSNCLLGFCQLQCNHYWEGDVPTASGNNIIDITVSGHSHSCTLSTEQLVPNGLQAPLAVIPSSTIPSWLSTDVPINTTVSATFNGQVDPQSVNSNSFKLIDQLNVIPTGKFSVDGSTVTFTPDVNLYGTTTYKTIISPEIKDINGIAGKNSFAWSFTTLLTADIRPPTVKSTSPSNGASRVANFSPITVTFSEPMMPSTINPATFVLDNGVTGKVSYNSDTNTASIIPSSYLAFSTTYTATITSNVKDAAGNAMTAPYSWIFTTDAEPPPPTLVSTNPASGMTGVAVNTIISAKFSQSMANSTIYLDNGVTSSGCCNSSSGYTASFVPSHYLAFATTYTATIPADVGDIVGISMGAPYNWSFTTAPVGAMFIVPDTGQTLCYTTSGYSTPCLGTGQDGEYTINPPSYTDNGDGTITDNVTGLVWQKSHDSLTMWTDANSYCNSLSLGGQTGWRLPTVMELVSIANYGANSSTQPLIDQTYFGIDNYYYWTSTPYLLDPSYVWSVDFKNATTDHSYLKLDGNSHFSHDTVCVRGDQATQKFIDNTDGTVTDRNTLLTWQQGEYGILYWQEAISYCSRLTLPNTTGRPWRVPTIKELSSLVNYSKQNPAIDTLMFPDTRTGPYTMYWSSTSLAYTDFAFAVNFTNGDIDIWSNLLGSSGRVRCVRGGQ
jgi:hypothetical protein